MYLSVGEVNKDSLNLNLNFQLHFSILSPLISKVVKFAAFLMKTVIYGRCSVRECPCFFEDPGGKSVC
jgi:hypothetical protein